MARVDAIVIAAVREHGLPRRYWAKVQVEGHTMHWSRITGLTADDRATPRIARSGPSPATLWIDTSFHKGPKPVPHRVIEYRHPDLFCILGL